MVLQGSSEQGEGAGMESIPAQPQGGLEMHPETNAARDMHTMLFVVDLVVPVEAILEAG